MLKLKLIFTIFILSLFLFTGRAALASAWVESPTNPIYDPAVAVEKAYYPSVLKMGADDYRMWYQSNSTPSNSTIAYATSADGISWTLQTNAVSGLITNNAGHPHVEFADGKFRIWYWNTATPYGNNAMHYAESIDGTTWTNDSAIAGNLISATGGLWNSGSYGAVDVIINDSPTNIGANPFDYKYAMYYDATSGGYEQIALGYSSDGVNWTLYGTAPVLSKGLTGSWDSGYATLGTIIRGDIWEMWYSGGVSASNEGMGYATSSDGLAWTKSATNPFMNKNDGVVWRNSRTYTPSIIEDGGDYKMWFTGRDIATGNYAIGYATLAGPATTGPVFVDANINGILDSGELFFNTIQDAITAASSGDTIYVTAGTYDEQVVISKNLILQGSGSGTVIRPSQATMNNFQLFKRNPGDLAANTAGIIVASSSAVTVKNLTVDGSLISSVPSSARFIGIFYRNSGGAITSNTVQGIGVNEGNGILATSLGLPVSIEIGNNTVSTYKKNGITANNAGVTANIHDNVITGMGPTALIAQNGIQIGFGATGVINGNTVSGNYWTGTYGGSNDPVFDTNADGAAGILLYESSSGVQVTNNNLSNNQFGIWSVEAAGTVSINDNIIVGGSDTGSAKVTGIAIANSQYGNPPVATTATVLGNTVSNVYYGLLNQDNAASSPPITSVHLNSFSDARSLFVFNNVATILDAANNWWGTASSTEITDKVGGSVDFTSWLLADPALATLHIEKVVINGSGGTGRGTLTPSDFMLHVKDSLGVDVSGSPVPGTSTPGTSYTLSAGTYTVSEDTNVSYVRTFTGTDCDANGTVTLAQGDNKTCTIVNTDIPLPVATPSGGGAPLPLINITKTSSPLALPFGPDSVTYTYTVENTGSTSMTSVWVKDNKCDPITYISGDTNKDSSLDVDESWIYGCTKTVLETETNAATAHGYANGWDAYDIANVTIIVGESLVPPLIHVAKKPDIFLLPAGGGAVTYAYTVTNPGTEALSDVSITDDKCTGLPGRVVGHPGDLNKNNLLESNESWSFTCQTNIKQTTTNVGVAIGHANGLIAVDLSSATVVVGAPGFPDTGSVPAFDQQVRAIAVNLGQGSKDNNVAILQQFLISQNKGPAAQALAKVGATAYFGMLTRAALAEFQVSAGINPPLGNFGPITRAYLAAVPGLPNAGSLQTENSGFNIGNRVMTIRAMNVRKEAGLSGGIFSTQVKSSSGVILGGPIHKDGYVWWQIKYGGDLTGWTAETGLTKAR